MFRGYRYRLEPTPAQAAVFTQWCGAVRFVYNLALEQRETFWRQYRHHHGWDISWMGQSRELTELRAQVDWLRDVSRNTLDFALRDLDRAFREFFAGRSGYPRYRARQRTQAFRVNKEEIAVKGLNARWSAVRIPKIGWVKFRDTRPRSGRCVSATVSCVRGAWFVSFAHELPDPAVTNTLPAVGIDRGVAVAAMLSTGEPLFVPDALQVLARRQGRLQRKLARCKRGSRRRLLAKQRVAAVAGRIAQVRMDWNHRNTTAIVRRFGTVALERLQVSKMTRSAAGTVECPGVGVAPKRSLNRSILNVGWYQFEQMLAYKLETAGGRLVLVDPKFTSQSCSECGVVDARSRKSQAIFECVECGHRANADHNAAINIRRRSTALLDVEGAHRAPAEPSTMAVA